MFALLRSIDDWWFERRVRRAQTRAKSISTAVRVGAKLVRLHRFHEADKVLETALAAWPKRADLLEQYAMSAHSSGRYEIALSRWEETRRADPDLAMAWNGIAANLRVIGNMPSANETVREALPLFPDDLAIAAEAARVFARSGNHAEAAAQWERLIHLDPVHEEWYQGYAFALLYLGQFEEARTVLDKADKDHPGNPDLLATRAHLEMAREDWNAALAIWHVYRKRYPDDRTGWEGQGRTIAAIQLARSEAEQPNDGVIKIEIETVDNEAIRSLVLGFESLGADCEFGLVQRRFGAEPLGLLRFNDVRLQDLMIALGDEFDRMGDPELTALIVSGSGEYYVTDVRWNLGMHTFLFTSQYETETLLPKMCRRVAYLRDKMLTDLRAAEKVFVYKGDHVDLDALRVLHRELRVYGPVRLLHVRRASVPFSDEPLPVAPGEVVLLEPDLYVGFLSRMGNNEMGWDIAFDEWLSICGSLETARKL